MKKLFILSVLFTLFTVGANAQRSTVVNRVDRTFNARLTKPELIRLHHDQLRYRLLNNYTRRDGIVTPVERRKLQKTRRKVRNDLYRFRHNDRNRVI